MANSRKDPAKRKKMNESSRKYVAKTRSKKRPEGKPAPPKKAFYLWMDDVREEIANSNPSDGMNKEASRRWKAMSDDDKAPYLEKANDLKEVYEQELEMYNETTKASNLDKNQGKLIGDESVMNEQQPKLVQLTLKSPVEKKRSIPALLKGVAKKDQTKCRACGHYFRKGPANKFICQKVECQNRKCKKCKEDRVCFKTKKCCKKCFGAK